MTKILCLCRRNIYVIKIFFDVKEYISIFATIFSDLVIFLSIYKFLSIIVKMLRKESHCSSLEETIHEKHFTQIISIFSIRRRKS